MEPPKYETKTLIDRKPVGYKDKGRTPQESLQTIGGPVKRDVTVNIGATKAFVKSGSSVITFTANPEARRKAPKMRLPKVTQANKAGYQTGPDCQSTQGQERRRVYPEK